MSFHPPRTRRRAALRRSAPPWIAAALLVLAACGGAEDREDRAASPPSTDVSSSASSSSPDTAGPVEVVDDAGRTVRLPRPARRVVSLLPAGTETLFALGAGDRVVGRTRYDEGPHVDSLPSVGGGLDPSLEALTALRPDLVLAFETAGGSSRLRDRLEALGVPVFAIRTQDTTDVFRTVERLGTLVGRRAAADSVAAALRARLDAVRASVPPGPRPTLVYVVSVDPPMLAGEGTFLHELAGVAGGEPLAVGTGLWPRVSLEALVRARPDVVVLPVFDDPDASVARLREAAGWRELEAVREGRIAVVSADLMNRPGPSIGEAAEVLRDAIRRAMEGGAVGGGAGR